MPPGALVLNAGSGFAPKVTGETINLDYYLLPPVDLVANVHRIPFERNTFDLVISEFVLEHVVAPPAVCSEMMRVPAAWWSALCDLPIYHFLSCSPR